MLLHKMKIVFTFLSVIASTMIKHIATLLDFYAQLSTEAILTKFPKPERNLTKLKVCTALLVASAEFPDVVSSISVR